MLRRFSVRLHEALDARYLYKAGRHTLAGLANGHGEPLSDHALLSIRLQRPAAMQRAALPATANSNARVATNV